MLNAKEAKKQSEINKTTLADMKLEAARRQIETQITEAVNAGKTWVVIGISGFTTVPETIINELKELGYKIKIDGLFITVGWYE